WCLSGSPAQVLQLPDQSIAGFGVELLAESSMIMLFASSDAIATVISTLPLTELSDADVAVTVTTPFPPPRVRSPDSSIDAVAAPLAAALQTTRLSVASSGVICACI